MTAREAIKAAACKVLKNLSSKKYHALGIATYLVHGGHIDSMSYTAIVLAFLGAQGALDFTNPSRGRPRGPSRPWGYPKQHSHRRTQQTTPEPPQEPQENLLPMSERRPGDL